ncbi:centrosomal protein of 120 kDa isoform X1 [Ooceraea biroi]|uniref:centrosomal protein of 120 kDa isoform X1 n=1 Tax=Ooceraea biroi TaxID=2015173 RepID=UPI000F07A1B8|nr:centrosomal protein of 120 kDa isoform X1 [Ooceraea biroi]
MIEAAESSVQIVLSIKEGKGFEQVLQPTLLLGTLNGHSLQTDRIDANPTPQYETDLVWETNKTTLRKMRSGQVPLKLECFAFKENGGKERLGYVLLSIRSAHVTSKHGDSSPRASWHKLLGLRNDFKTQKPQLLLTLKIEDRKNMDSNPTAEILFQRRPEIEYHRNPAGDFERFSSRNISSEAKCETQQIADRQCPKYQSDKITHSYPCDAIFCNCVNRNYPKGVTSYHCFCLNISLAAITLVSDRLSGRQIEFRFHHPKAEITSTTRVTMPVSSERAKLHDIGCQFHFISAPDEIKQLLQSFPPKISMHDTNENAKSLSLLMLDMKPLFYQDKPECQYKLPMYDTDGNKIGEIDVILKLENHGPHFVLKKEITGKNLGPPILDDSLAYKIVDELETWKDRQKEIFKVELKKKEERYLNMLSEEWRKQKENLESKLACSVEQCKMLANSLNNATEDLRTRRLKSLENESRLIKANEDVQWRYEVKLQELKDSLHAMQSELTSKVTKLEEKKAALETQMELLLYENENLKMSMNKQTQELQMYQKASLTQDQTASLLQEIKVLEEKLDNAQKGKSFFKERWGKAVREIHRMKLDNQCAMQVQIKNSKEELKNVDLAEMLSMDTKALNNDQMLLHELQKEIDIIKPSASKETYNEIFMPSERYNERLQALKEERDSLLRTGSYAADDVVIKRLNTEIQSLLISR